MLLITRKLFWSAGVLLPLLRCLHVGGAFVKLAAQKRRQDRRTPNLRHARAAAAAGNCASMYASNASMRGAIASLNGKSAAIASVVLSPFPVMHTTVVSSG